MGQCRRRGTGRELHKAQDPAGARDRDADPDGLSSGQLARGARARVVHSPQVRCDDSARKLVGRHHVAELGLDLEGLGRTPLGLLPVARTPLEKRALPTHHRLAAGVVPLSVCVSELREYLPGRVELERPDELSAELLGRPSGDRPGGERPFESHSLLHVGPANARPRSKLPVAAGGERATSNLDIVGSRRCANGEIGMLETALESLRPRHRAGKSDLDRRDERGDRLCLGERLAVQRQRVARIVVKVRESDECPGPVDPGRGLDAGPLEQVPGMECVTRAVVHVRSEEQATAPVVPQRRRGQVERVLRKRGGGCRCPAIARRSRGCLEGRGDLGIGLGRCESQMTGSFLCRRCDLRKPSLQRPAARRRLARGDRSGQQRVREAQAYAVDLENPGADRFVEPGVGAGAERRIQQVDGRVAARCDEARNVERGGAQTLEALVQEGREGGWERQVLAWNRRGAAPLQRGGELEREERVARGRLAEPEQRRTGERDIQARAEELVCRADAEPAQLDPLEPGVGQGWPEPLRRRAANGQQSSDRLALEPRHPEAKCRERGPVEPLDVVDAEDERACGCEEPQSGEEPGGDCALVDLGPRIAEQQRGLERVPLDGRELGKDVVHDAAEQIGHSRIREPCLCVGRAARQDAVAARGRTGDRSQPYGGLADPGRTVEQDNDREQLGVVEEAKDRPELALPAEELAGRGVHAAVLSPRMAYEFKLPDLGEGLTEAEIARWLVKEGAEIAEDAPLVEVQTDKTTVEIPSPRAGTVLKILVAEGTVAPVGAVLVVIGEEGEQLLRAVDETQSDGGDDAEETEPLVAVVPASPDAAVRATPAVRRLARSLGVELLDIQGTGPGGRIVEADVQAAAAGTSDGTRIPVRGIRRMIGENLSRAHREIPAVTFVEECDFTGVDVSRLVALVIHASAQALARFSELNARLEGDAIVLLDRIDVGIAVQTDDGLVVPVVRGCERLGVDEIDAESRRLAEGARGGSLSADELRDSTFTVTSAGKLGGLLVTPLVNHPEVAILGVHRIAQRPVVRDGQIVVRTVGNLSVTFDHRVVDGVRAAAFCLDVIEQLETGAGA